MHSNSCNENRNLLKYLILLVPFAAILFLLNIYSSLSAQRNIDSIILIDEESEIDQHGNYIENKLRRLMDLHNQSEISHTLNKVGWCVPTLWTKPEFQLDALKQWEKHYVSLGVSSAFIYLNNAGDFTTDAAAKAYLKSNPFWQVFPNKQAQTTYFGQSYAINHCFDQVKKQGFKYAGFGDLDEYIWWNTNDQTIGEWLDNNYADNECVTIGKRKHAMTMTYNYSYEYINNTTEYLSIFHLPYTPTMPTCHESRSEEKSYYCDGWQGARKYMIKTQGISSEAQVTTHNCIQFKNKTVLHADTEACFHEFPDNLNKNPWRGRLNIMEDAINIKDERIIQAKIGWGGGISFIVQSYNTDKYPNLEKDDRFLDFVQRRYQIDY